MAKFSLTIDCDNAAFGEATDVEVARILASLADDIARHIHLDRADVGTNDSGVLRDINGNMVGLWRFDT